MKSIKYIGLAVLAAAALFTSCKNEPESGAAAQFGPDKDVITVGPTGATESVALTATQAWVATTDQAWLLVSPANGDASQVCRIRIDSTYQDVMRDGEVRFTSGGQTRTVKIKQMGFLKQIVIEGAENGVYAVNLPDYAAYGTTYFDVNVTTNVDFNIQIEDHTIIPDDAEKVSGTSRADSYPTAAWLKNADYKLELVESKPRTVKIRFNWEYNTKWWKQKALIRFIPKETVDLAQQEVVNVEQTEAPRITDDRAGDSIAVLAIARQLNMYASTFDSSKSMLDWGDIELYTKADGVDKDGKPLAGRVKYVRFFFFDTKAPIPFEVRYLTRAEEIIFYSNINNSIKDINIGTSLVELAKYGYLKKLSIDAFGISELPEEFVQLGSTLESLSLASENFTEIPSMINKNNFPHLKKLNMSANRRVEVYDLSNSSVDKPGLGGQLPRHLFEWENLEELNFSYDYFEGSIPDMKDYEVRWTAEDRYPTLVGKPKVLPNIKVLRLNLNRLTGELPEWLLNHPNVVEWDPYMLIFTQEGKDSNGKNGGFSNVPDKLTPPIKE